MPASDPTFYRSPGAAVAAAPEHIAYVAAFDPAGQMKDALAVVDCDASSSTYSRVVGWAELPMAGNELHHFGWNACSSALCHDGHGDHHGEPLERRYLLVPGIRSSNTYVLDTKPDPRRPVVTHTIEATELAAKAGYSRPHTVHCGPGGIFMSALGGANGQRVCLALWHTRIPTLCGASISHHAARASSTNADSRTRPAIRKDGKDSGMGKAQRLPHVADRGRYTR
jgi:selenium-binding protein 1